MVSYLDEFLNKPRDPVNPFDLDRYISNYPGKDRIQELQNIDYANNPRDMGVGTASDFRHSAAMNELSKSLSPGFVPDFVGDSLAYGLGAINEIPDAFRGFSFTKGFDPQAKAAAKEDFAANYTGTFGTPNTATIEDVFAKTLGYQAPGTNIQTASAIENPMGYGAAQASELTDLERDFPGMSTGDIIDSMNNRQAANRYSGMGQVGPVKSDMAAPRSLDMERFAGVSELGRNDADVEQVEYLGSPSKFQNFKSRIDDGLGSFRNKASQGWDFAQQLPGMAMGALSGIPGIGALMGMLPKTSPEQKAMMELYNSDQYQDVLNQIPGMANYNPVYGMGAGYGLTNAIGKRLATINKTLGRMTPEQLAKTSLKKRKQKLEELAALEASKDFARTGASGRRPGSGGGGQGTPDSGGTTGGYSYDSGGRQGYGYGLKYGGRVRFSDGGLATLFARRG